MTSDMKRSSTVEEPVGAFVDNEGPYHEKEKDVIYTTAADYNEKDEENLRHRGSQPHFNENDEEEPIDSYTRDPFVPFDDLPEENRNYLTVRAMLTGIVLGALVNASNIYLGLKTGWTFTANIFGGLAGFAICKFFATVIPAHLPFGGPFGPKENGIIMTAAMASGGISSVFVSAWPAMYQLHLLSEPPRPLDDYWRMVAITATGGYFGFLFATPLRKFFIIYVAKELHLIFPSFAATAVAIRSMHRAVTGEAVAKMKMKALSISFAFAFILRVVSQYALGILWDWHIFTWFYIWGNYNNSAMAVENWGWYIEWTPAFIGIGMLVGMNVATSFFAGTVLAWGIIGPALIATDTAYGIQACDGKWSTVVSFYDLSPESSTKTAFSPRYWLLWPGVLTMLVVSFVELFCQWKVFWIGFKAFGRMCVSGFKKLKNRNVKIEETEDELNDPDPAAPEDRVRMWMWVPPIIVVIVLTCVVMAESFSMPVGESLLAIFLAFFFSFLAIQCTGATDITPLTAASKASQLLLGADTAGYDWSIQKKQRLNLLGGGLASVGAGQASDLTGDFRSGFLLGVKPKLQWVAQGIGTVVAIFLAPAMFALFAKAYPCILNENQLDDCPFSVPSVAAWRAVAEAVTVSDLPVPTSSGIFAIVLSIIGGCMVLIRHFFLVGPRAHWRRYWPNVMVAALPFVIPQTVYGTATIMGAGIAWFWARKWPKHHEIYCIAAAAGLVAGEGIGGVINAIFQIAGISGPSPYGTNIACPCDFC